MSLVATAEALGVGYSSAARDPLAVPAADVQQEMAYRLAIVAEYRDDDTGAHAARSPRSAARSPRGWDLRPAPHGCSSSPPRCTTSARSRSPTRSA